MYRNIVFDLGNVVVSYEPKDYLAEKFFHEKTEKKIYDAMFGSQEWILLDKGLITWREASDTFLKRGAEKDISFEMQTAVDEWLEMLSTKKSTISLMKILKKKGFNLYYLSNISAQGLAYLEQKDFWFLFNGGAASHEIGVNKPDRALYEFLLEKYELVPQETIFTDDKKDNASAAFEVGITGIQFKTIRNLCKMLVTYGIEVQEIR